MATSSLRGEENAKWKDQKQSVQPVMIAGACIGSVNFDQF